MSVGPVERKKKKAFGRLSEVLLDEGLEEETVNAVIAFIEGGIYAVVEELGDEEDVDEDEEDEDDGDE